MTLSEHYFRINPNTSNAPLYQQIHDNLLELIDNNLLQSGDSLPSERVLSECYKVNRMTVRQAIDSLVQKGLLIKKQGAGTFVGEKKAVPSFTPSVIGFSQRIRESGGTPSSQVLGRELLKPDAILSHRLQLQPDEQVIMIKRLRLVNNDPLMIETSYLSHALFPRLLTEKIENQSLYRLLEDIYGMSIVEAEHTLEPTLPNAFEARQLGVELNQPAMLVRVTAYSVDHIPIEFSKSVIRGDRSRYYLRVNTRKPIIT